MSHHYSGPDYGFPHGDARLDITDLYVFPKPGAMGKSILIMNVHPSAGVNPEGPTTDQPFATDAVYERWYVPDLVKEYPHDGQRGLAVFATAFSGACICALVVFIVGTIWTIRTSRGSRTMAQRLKPS